MNKSEEDQALRDFLQSSAFHIDESKIDEPTICALYDTAEVLSRKDSNWRNNKFCQKIFVWQSRLFLADHVKEVCESKCPELLALCVEYRDHETIMGQSIEPFLGLQALEYISQQTKEDLNFEKFGCAPVRDAYFKIMYEDHGNEHL